MYQDRLNALHKISGLTVRQRKDSLTGELIFEFISDNNFCLKSVYTYKKAKIFAEGIRIGRSIPFSRSIPCTVQG